MDDLLDLDLESDDSDLIVEKVVVVKKKPPVTHSQSKAKLKSAKVTHVAPGSNAKPNVKPYNFLLAQDSDGHEDDELPDLPEEGRFLYSQSQSSVSVPSPPKKSKVLENYGVSKIKQIGSSSRKDNFVDVFDVEDDDFEFDTGFGSSKIPTASSSAQINKLGSEMDFDVNAWRPVSLSSAKNQVLNNSKPSSIASATSSSSSAKDLWNYDYEYEAPAPFPKGPVATTSSKSKASSKTSNGKSSSQASNSSTGATQTQLKKDKEKEAKEREKELKRLEREQKKQELEKEKELKKTENELRRNAKPGEAEKFLTMQLDGSLPHKDELISFFLEREFNYEIVQNALIEKSVTFRRETKYQAMDDQMKLQLISRFDDEAEIMVYLDPDDIVPKVYQELYPDPSEDEITLTNYVQSIQSLNKSKKITLLIYGMDNYFKKIKKSSQQEFRDRVLNGDQEKQRNRRKKKQLPSITTLEFQSLMIEVQLTTQINYRLVNRVKELATLLTQYLKAIAAAPFKRLQKEQGFDWFAAADSAGSVKIEKDGTGFAQLWLEQIQLFGKVGTDTAQAIVRHYPTPFHLYSAYKDTKSHDDGLKLLSDITVRSGTGPLARTRRVGPEISKKIYHFFTSTDPDRYLGSQQDF